MMGQPFMYGFGYVKYKLSARLPSSWCECPFINKFLIFRPKPFKFCFASCLLSTLQAILDTCFYIWRPKVYASIYKPNKRHLCITFYVLFFMWVVTQDKQVGGISTIFWHFFSFLTAQTSCGRITGDSDVGEATFIPE